MTEAIKRLATLGVESSKRLKMDVQTQTRLKRGHRFANNNPHKPRSKRLKGGTMRLVISFLSTNRNCMVHLSREPLPIPIARTEPCCERTRRSPHARSTRTIARGTKRPTVSKYPRRFPHD